MALTGSFQLTVQELSTMIAHDLNVTMFLIENEGYTIVSANQGDADNVLLLLTSF